MKKDEPAPGRFPIVGIGASAGGLEALDQFFSKMPEDNGLAFVIVQHLDPKHKGIMPELIQRVTTMKVYQVTDHLKVKPNCVYVIPPNKNMSVLSGKLHLFDLLEPHGLKMPIDFFFHSLADDMGGQSIGIILSGMGSDGSLGLRSIKEKGGAVLVQEPSSAKYDGMPRSAIDAVLVDIIAPPEELPVRLLSFLKYILTIRTGIEPGVRERSSLEKIIILIRSKTGNDFSLYKKSTIYRRIERRMVIHNITRITAYIRFLQENPAEIDLLFKELLIGATNFFRDIAVWDQLKEKVIPLLLSEKPDGHVIRAWVPACSTGEEAYSLAIIFREVFDQIKPRKNLSFLIFASDLDTEAIEKARTGFFPANIVASLSLNRLNRFFTKLPDGYKIKSEIREMVIFASQNIVNDPPFTKLDIVSCRNLMIYLEPALQKKLLSVIHFSLRPAGILVLGTSETVGPANALFDPVDAKFRLYRKTHLEIVEAVEFPTYIRKSSSDISKEVLIPVKNQDNIQSLTDRLILQYYSPASVLVTKDGDIIYLTSRTGKYLEPVTGKANMNIFAMLREGLSFEFPIAFRKALQGYDKVVLPNIKVGTNGGVQFVDIIIQHLEKPDPLKGMLIVIFKDVPAVDIKQTGSKKGTHAHDLQLREMEIEQQRLRDELQSTLEAMQVSDEELKSTNEELQSTNEELQSTNEELTTSKEELQSMNEELQTVNYELMSKVEDFSRMTNDMNNLLESTDIATLFLDKDLMIRRFTSRVTKIFNLIQSDIGRSINDLSSEMLYPGLKEDLEEVLRTIIIIEKPVRTQSDKWFSIRIIPYRTSDDRIDGLVITFSDITLAKNLEAELNKTISVLRSHNL